MTAIQTTKTLSRRDQLAYDLYLLRDEAVHDVWIGSPFGLDLDDSNRDCVLCERPLNEGPAAGWYARNSGGEWLMGHSFCVKRAVMYGTPPGRSARSGEPGAILYVIEDEFISDRRGQR